MKFAGIGFSVCFSASVSFYVKTGSNSSCLSPHRHIAYRHKFSTPFKQTRLTRLTNRGLQGFQSCRGKGLEDNYMNTLDCHFSPANWHLYICNKTSKKLKQKIKQGNSGSSGCFLPISGKYKNKKCRRLFTNRSTAALCAN